MTARDIQRRLMFDRYRRSVVCPNYKPLGWFECDVFELTKSGFFREYEIKLTHSDFLADAYKTKTRKFLGTDDQGTFNDDVRLKHDLLRVRRPNGPVQFWFVCPGGIISPSEVPEWAGLLVCSEFPTYRPPLNVKIEEIKKAPRLHNQKLDSAAVEHLKGIFYWRFQNLFIKHDPD